MTGTIICGVDESDDSHAVLSVAAGLANRMGSRLLLVHVAELPHIPYAAAAPFGGTAGAMAVTDEIGLQREAAERLLDRVAANAGLSDVERRVAVGSPAESLADLADEEGAELIVVGSRGRGAFKAAFLGSVSNSLVGVSRHPVLIVPPGVTDIK
jgi:nucleotide-binding universal stress UspA family protein